MKRLDKLTLSLPCLNSRARLISRVVPNVRKLLEDCNSGAENGQIGVQEESEEGVEKRGTLSKSVEGMRDGQTGQEEEAGRAR